MDAAGDKYPRSQAKLQPASPTRITSRHIQQPSTTDELGDSNMAGKEKKRSKQTGISNGAGPPTSAINNESTGHGHAPEPDGPAEFSTMPVHQQVLEPPQQRVASSRSQVQPPARTSYSAQPDQETISTAAARTSSSSTPAGGNSLVTKDQRKRTSEHLKLGQEPHLSLLSQSHGPASGLQQVNHTHTDIQSYGTHSPQSTPLQPADSVIVTQLSSPPSDPQSGLRHGSKVLPALTDPRPASQVHLQPLQPPANSPTKVPLTTPFRHQAPVSTLSQSLPGGFQADTHSGPNQGLNQLSSQSASLMASVPYPNSGQHSTDEPVSDASSSHNTRSSSYSTDQDPSLTCKTQGPSQLSDARALTSNSALRHDLAEPASLPLSSPSESRPSTVLSAKQLEELGVRLQLTVQHALHPKLMQINGNVNDLLELKADSKLYCAGKNIEAVRINNLPKQLQQPPSSTFFIRADMNDTALHQGRDLILGKLLEIKQPLQSASSVLSEAASQPFKARSMRQPLQPAQPQYFCRLYVLWPACMRTPRWLKSQFSEVPGGMEVKVDWHVSGSQRMLLWIARKQGEMEAQGLRVWQSLHTYSAGQDFRLGGPGGLGELTDRPYVLCIRFATNPADLDLNGDSESSGKQSNLEAWLKKEKGLYQPGKLLAHMQPGASALMRAEQETAKLVSESDTEIVIDEPFLAAYVPSALQRLPRRLRIQIQLDKTKPGKKVHHVHLTKDVSGQYCIRGIPARDLPVGCYLRGWRKGATGVSHLVMLASSSTGSKLFPPTVKGPWHHVLDVALTKRDLDMVKVLIKSDRMKPVLEDPEMVRRTCRLACVQNDLELLLRVHEHSGREISTDALKYMVKLWALHATRRRALTEATGSHDVDLAASMYTSVQMDQSLPPRLSATAHHDALDVERFLVTYIVERRNPLSATAAVLQAIQNEIKDTPDAKRFLQVKYAAFHSLHIALLKKLNRLTDDDSGWDTLERVLRPKQAHWASIHEVSPLQVAFEVQDLEFVSENVCISYVQDNWRGHDFAALTVQDNSKGISVLSPLMGYRILRNIGFAGGIGDPLLALTSRLWHCYVMTSGAFFNSPRGRWAMHAMCELAFLTLYQLMIMYPRDPRQPALLWTFLAFILGNIVDIFQFVYFKWGAASKLKKYAVDPWNALNLVVNSALLVLTILKLLQTYKVGGMDAYESGDAIHMAAAVMAVLVWVRALSLVVPVYPRLGPLLNTVARMVEEVVAFVFPMVVMLTGFSTMMTAVFQEQVQEYENFAVSMLQLFSSMLGNFDFSAFESGLPLSQALYGSITLIVFLVISAILLMNLLIAIITYRYQPEQVEAETQFKQAQIVDYYMLQVRYNLTCSPFSLVHWMLFWMPQGTRKRLHTGHWRRFGVMPMDGNIIPSNTGDRLGTGRGEFPHLVFLLTLYPLLAVVANLLFYAHLPFAVWEFATKGRYKWLKAVRQHNKVHSEEETRKATAPEVHGWLDAVVWLLSFVGFLLTGIAGYLLVIGVFAVTTWTTLYCWLAKLLYSLYNFLLREPKNAISRWYAQRHSQAEAHDTHTQGVHDANGHMHTDEPASAVGGKDFLAKKSVRQQHSTATDTRGRWHGLMARFRQEFRTSYPPRVDVLKALAASKFGLRMERWGLVAAQKTDDDQLEQEMEDVEDADDEAGDAGMAERMQSKILETVSDLQRRLDGLVQASVTSRNTVLSPIALPLHNVNSLGDRVSGPLFSPAQRGQ